MEKKNLVYMRRMKLLQVCNWFIPPLVAKTTNSIPAGKLKNQKS